MRKPVLKQPLFALMTPKQLKLPHSQLTSPLRQDDARRHTASLAELRYALLPSLSVLGAAEAFTGGSVLLPSLIPRFLCLGRQRPSLAAQCVRS